MSKQPDILIFMSDQHGAAYLSDGSVPVDTPNIDALRAQGTSFDNAYTPCPLCVPARMAMMSGLLPTSTGITGNSDTLPSSVPCFTHSLALAGYETVLIGRMHFIGQDQRHGFQKRLAPDFTPVGWSFPKALLQERGLMMGTTGEPWCCDIVGAGENMVNHYDDEVVNTALEYLRKPHDKPQFILVGTYGPHFPYVAEEELFHKYMARVQKPNFFDAPAAWFSAIPTLSKRRKEDVSWEVGRGCLAAYCAQVERTDALIGRVRAAFDEYQATKGAQGILGYTSDHGDQAGEHRIFGKMTLFDKSAQIPFILAGEGITKNQRVTAPASLLDLGPTLCDLGGGEPLLCDGQSLAGYLCGDVKTDDDRIIISQMVEGYSGQRTASAMARWKQYKYIVYHRSESNALLFDMYTDPEETTNIAAQHPDIVEKLAQAVQSVTPFAKLEAIRAQRDANAKILGRFEQLDGGYDTERWKNNPPTARGTLTTTIATRTEMVDYTKGKR